MDAINYLRAKKILHEDCTKWIVKFEDGREFDIVQLLEHYAELNRKDLKIKIEEALYGPPDQQQKLTLK